MSKILLNFEQWRTVVQKSPERVVDQFSTRLQVLSPHELQGWIAATTNKYQLLEELSAAIALDIDDAPLAGIPYVLQDMFDVKGMPTGYGAPFTELYESPLDDSCLLYQKLDTLGACLFAKTRPSEFGVDPQGLNSTYGTSKHSDGEKFVCGGGAGSVARTVCDGIAPLGFGLDTAGGIRIPAAFHGLFGFRMPSNAYALDGVFPIVPSIESVGWVNNCIADLCTTFHALHQISKRGSIDTPHGYFVSELATPLAPEIHAGIASLTRELHITEDPEIGTQLRRSLAQAASAYQTLEARELYSIHRYLFEEHHPQYDPILSRRIQAGITCKTQSAEKCADVQHHINHTFTKFFKKYDYLVLPISPVVNPYKTEWNQSLEQSIIELIAPASLACLPALILPFRCAEDRHSAVQVIINPRKLHIVPELLAQLTGYYEDLKSST